MDLPLVQVISLCPRPVLAVAASHMLFAEEADQGVGTSPASASGPAKAGLHIGHLVVTVGGAQSFV
ncbi:hypothetical protein NKH57_12165 [Mesorhizobium sp. M1050]|uniref:hypothetical protein n=1 Tax=Mesorhizobium sp. M1050 TaxID=2957051 RepID=UPI003335F618